MLAFSLLFWNCLNAGRTLLNWRGDERVEVIAHEGEGMRQHDLLRIIGLRRQLHENAELSGHEQGTAELIRHFLASSRPKTVLSGLGGGAGLAMIYHGEGSGPTIVLRSDLDALPIQETRELAHCSRNPEVSHKCGHDGHMAILAGLALRLQQTGLRAGKLVLVFQPAEETGAGALEVMSDRRFAELRPDYVFALHNLPGYPLGQVLIRPGVFACASRGMIIRLSGASAHAACPEKALSPNRAFIEILQGLTQLSASLNSLSLVTVVYARLGEITFGTTPGSAEIMATLRSDHDEHLERLAEEAEELARRAVRDSGLGLDIRWRDEFSTTVNHRDAVEIVRQAAAGCGLGISLMDEPFRWSEDFGEFLGTIPGALFCVGAGEDHPPLHHPEYDFPDELIATGICIFEKIVHSIL
jgi:amidohydrolase